MVIRESVLPQDRLLRIRVTGLTKRFPGVTAVDDISFDVYPGELFGFLGPNGAGKTTTINMLLGLARPDGGTIHVTGLESSRHPKRRSLWSVCGTSTGSGSSKLNLPHA